MKIAVIDDSIVVRKIVTRFLKSLPEDYMVFDAKDGEEAVELIREERPDLVFLDIVMPKLDGLEVVQKLKEEGIDTKIVLLTMDIRDVVKQKAFDLGVWKFLNKPFKEDKIATVLEEYLESFENVHQNDE